MSLFKISSLAKSMLLVDTVVVVCKVDVCVGGTTTFFEVVL